MRIRTVIGLGLAAAVIGGLLAPVGGAEAAPTAASEAQSVGPVFYDNADSAAWTYAGTWGAATGQPWTRGEHGDSETWSNETGARAQLQFFGTGVIVRGPKGPNGGDFRVTIDCTYVVQGTSYAPSKVMAQPLAVADTLPRGWHTVTIEVLGSHPAGSSDDYVMIDVAEARDEPPRNDAEERYAGSSDVTQAPSGRLTLRRPGCGAASSLVDAVKARVVNGRFSIPGDGGTTISGAVNARSSVGEGAVTIGGVAVEAASIPVGPGVRLPLALPDRPRLIAMSLAADESAGVPVSFGVTDSDGDFLPVTVLEDGEDRARRVAGEAVDLRPGVRTQVIVDLRGAAAAGGRYDAVTLWAASDGGRATDLDIVGGRTSDLSPERFALQWGADVLPQERTRVIAAQEAFMHGPIMLSRVLADSARPAWTGDQGTPAAASGVAVPILFGQSAPGVPLRVDGVELPSDSVGIRLPAATGGAATSSVDLRFDTGRRCRALTASVGIDDSTPDKAAASVSIGVYGDGSDLALHHNGVWAAGPIGDSSPLTNSTQRLAFAAQLRSAKFEAVASLGNAAGANSPAMRALIDAEATAYSATATETSAALMTYRVPSPVRLGAGSNVREGAPSTFLTSGDQVQGVTPISTSALFPLSADLITERMRSQLRWAATGKLIGVDSVEAPLVGTVDVVISGTPGAVVVLGSAGVECVSVDAAADGTPAPVRVMPRWSQLGVAPLFLPAARGAGGQALDELTSSPMWWDLVCPQGPTTEGYRYAATRVRVSEYHYSRTEFGSTFRTTVQVTEAAHASKPACAFPADQVREDYGAYERVSGDPLPDDAVLGSVTITDPVRAQFDDIGAGWATKFVRWAKRVIAETAEDAVGWAVWLILAPLDPVGALIFNPFTMHALPVELQIVAGLGYAAAESLIREGVVRVFGGASRSSAGFSELLYTSAARAETEVASGAAALLDLGHGGGRVLVPLKSPTTADLVMERLASPAVRADSVTARLPIAEGRVPWVEDAAAVTGEEAALRCTRDVEMKCTTSGGLITPSLIRLTPSKTWRSGAIPIPAKRPSATHVDANVPVEPGYTEALDYAQRYAAGATLTTAVSGTEDAVGALAAMRLVRKSASIDPAGAYFQFGTGPRQPVVLATDHNPLYRFDTRSPNEIFMSGFDLEPRGTAPGRSDRWLNVWESANPDTHPGSFAQMKSTTRDPDMLATQFNSKQISAHWRYKITRPEGGGGIDVLATFRRYKSVDPRVAEAAEDSLILGEAEVLFPGGIDQSFIERADYVEWNPLLTRWEVLTSIPNPAFDTTLTGGAVPGLSVAERAGVSDLSPQDWAAFDWLPRGSADALNLEILPPSVDLARSRLGHSGSNLVYSKNLKNWILVPEWFDLTEGDLAQAGFVVGYWEQTLGSVQTWIPKLASPPAGFRASTKQPVVKRDVADDPTVRMIGAAGALNETTSFYVPTGAGGGVFDVTSGTDSGARSQWRVVPVGSGVEVRFLNLATGRALQLTGQLLPDDSATSIVVASPAEWNSDWQRWTIEPFGVDGVVIRSAKDPALVLAASPDGCATAAGCVAIARASENGEYLWLLQ